MSEMTFGDLLLQKDGLIKGPFGGDIKKSLFVPKADDTYKVYEQGVVLNHDINRGDYYVSKEYFEKKLKRFEVKENDILLTGAGTLGELFVVPPNAPKGVINQALLRIRLNKEVVNQNFFCYYFKYYVKSIISNINGDSVIPNLPPLPIIKSTVIDIPDISYQQKIAAVLTALDAKIELNARINAELESMAKTLYDYWFVQFEFPTPSAPPDGRGTSPKFDGTSVEFGGGRRGYKSAGGKMVWNEELKREIPLGWEVYELSKIVSRIATGLNPRKNFVFGNGNNYYVTIKNIDYGKVILDDRCDKVDDEALQIIDRRSDLQIGDILFTSIEPVGKTYLLQEKPRNWNINESVFTIRPNYELVTSEYLYSLLSSDMIKSFTNQSSAGSTFKGIRIGVLNTFLSAYPDKKLISDFSEIVKPILKKIDMLQKESQTLTELRDWLLPMLMNGQVRVSAL